METQALMAVRGLDNHQATLQTFSEPVLLEPSLLKEKAFILANTIPILKEEIERDHIIPVFVKDNEPLISHVDFIEAIEEAASHVFLGETISKPSVRLSHPVKGRVPEARHKPAKELFKHEETIYYERSAFVIELPSITTDVNGNRLCLTIGGVKSYNLDNLYTRKGADEHFKLFIGFENRVCTNMCVWSDGFIQTVKAKRVADLINVAYELFSKFDPYRQLEAMKQMNNYALSESQFAKLIGKGRMYQYLPNNFRKELPKLLFPDGHLSAVVRDYYQDESFCRDDHGTISLWRLYNLFTGANKQSYIDTFLDRSVNAYDFVSGIGRALDNGGKNWFLD